MSVGIIITARLKSKRLKKKLLKKINGRPMISHLISRLKLSKKHDKIIISTSVIPQDDPLEELARKEGVSIFRGDPFDVLKRIHHTAVNFDIKTIISCTGDNPFIDPLYIDKMVNFHLENKLDFTRCVDLPFGTFAYALDCNALKKACEIKDTDDSENWVGYFTDTGVFKHGVLNVDDELLKWPQLRLTVDTIEDFNLIKVIFNELGRDEKIFSLKQIVSFCKSRPDILKTNQHIKQRASKPIKLKLTV
jgi:spore coat polysaccharide biosynthesis protein SpsF